MHITVSDDLGLCGCEWIFHVKRLWSLAGEKCTVMKHWLTNHMVHCCSTIKLCWRCGQEVILFITCEKLVFIWPRHSSQVPLHVWTVWIKSLCSWVEAEIQWSGPGIASNTGTITGAVGRLKTVATRRLGPVTANGRPSENLHFSHFKAFLSSRWVVEHSPITVKNAPWHRWPSWIVNCLLIFLLVAAFCFPTTWTVWNRFFSPLVW